MAPTSPLTRQTNKAAYALLALSLIAFSSTASARACHEDVLEAEQKYDIPRGLLLAMALVESGRDGTPDAYAMNVNGRTMFADSPDDAARHFRDRQGHLKSNVFVGCLQLSLKHHSSAFRPIRQIADPVENTEYAARYLARHYEEYGSWTKAVARFNGTSGRRAQAYVCKVWNAMSSLDRDGARVLESGHCTPTRMAVAPRTRRALRDAQVAEHGTDTAD